MLKGVVRTLREVGLPKRPRNVDPASDDGHSFVQVFFILSFDAPRISHPRWIYCARYAISRVVTSNDFVFYFKVLLPLIILAICLYNNCNKNLPQNNCVTTRILKQSPVSILHQRRAAVQNGTEKHSKSLPTMISHPISYN